MKTKLDRWMNHFDINPVELAEKTGLSQKFISKWLSGESTIPLACAVTISDCFGITLDNLVNTDPEEFKGEFSEYHIIETKNFVAASRLQNYLEKNEIPHEVIVVQLKGKDDCFTIRYRSKYPIELKEIRKIAKSRKYKDVRERLTSDEDKYAGMSICKL